MGKISESCKPVSQHPPRDFTALNKNASTPLHYLHQYLVHVLEGADKSFKARVVGEVVGVPLKQ